MEEILELLSLPETTIQKIRDNAEQEFEQQLKNRKMLVSGLEKEL